MGSRSIEDLIAAEAAKRPEPVSFTLSAVDAGWLIFFLGYAQGGLERDGLHRVAGEAARLSREIKPAGALPGDHP